MLGRIPSPPDSRDHPLSLYVPHLAAVIDALPVSYAPKHTYPVLDQGDTPRCVGYSSSLSRTVTEWADVMHTLKFDSDELYAQCKAIDGIPNEDGTFPRAACKVMQDTGAKVIYAARGSGVRTNERLKIEAYARLTSLDEVKSAIALYGCALFGSDWYDSWFQPDSKGVLPAPDSVAGGHAYLAIGYNDTKRTPYGVGAMKFQNSWGTSWGLTGKFWMPYSFINLSDSQAWEAWRTIDIVGDR